MSSDRQGDEVLQYDGSETHRDSIEGEITRHYWYCPSCKTPLCAWMDCLECGWYDEGVWEATLAEGPA